MSATMRMSMGDKVESKSPFYDSHCSRDDLGTSRADAIALHLLIYLCAAGIAARARVDGEVAAGLDCLHHYRVEGASGAGGGSALGGAGLAVEGGGGAVGPLRVEEEAVVVGSCGCGEGEECEGEGGLHTGWNWSG